MSKNTSPWILTLLFATASATASAQEASGGPISRLVGRLRQPSHQHVHVQPAAPAYDYTYAEAQPAPEAAVAEQAEDPVAEQAEPAAAAVEQPTQAAQAEEADNYYDYATAGDPYGFAQILNRIRASAGLPALAYDPNLSSWAYQNNVEQCRRGLGHHVNAGGFQNCAYNYSDANSAAVGWMNSPGHRRNMLEPSATHFGIAFGPGPYWTLNAR